ncbi:MAG TPA: DUF4345 family protein [Myxococcota bacterium]|nr:DUF4345 family protein [Myxococcota bacterium]
MLAIRIFLGLCALLWLPYGLYCLANPGSLAGAAGVEATSVTGGIELRAMYGGLQAAIGALALAGALRTSLAPHALLALGSVAAGLGVTRIASAASAGEFSSYTVMALGLEWTMLVFAFALFRRVRPASA